MPTAPTFAKAQLLSSNQFMVRSGAFGNMVFEPPPAQHPQPLGSTPVWCEHTPTGSTDQVFHKAATGEVIYFPSFAIAMDDGGKPKVKFTQANKAAADTLLTVTLEPQPVTAAQQASAGNAALTVCPPELYADASGRDTTDVQLVYSGGTKRLKFDSITPDIRGRLTCVLKMTDYKTIGEVMGTLVNHDNDASKHASIVVTRTLAAVGVSAGTAPATSPAAPPSAPASTPPSAPTNIRFMTAPMMASRQMMMHREVMIANPGTIRFQPHPFPVPPQPDPTPTPTPTPDPTPVYIILNNQPVAATIDNVWFLDTISADIVGGVAGVTPTQAGYVQRTVPGYDNPLFRDVNDECAYFYLPDAFKIARQDTAPFLPLLNVTITGSTFDDAQATVFFTAVPVVDAQKLQAAQDLIQKDHTGETITMQPLPTPKGVSYGLYLPGTTPFVTRAVPVALDQPLGDSPQLSLSDFQTAFSSLTDKLSQYFQGKITVPVGDNVVAIPLVAHADDFPGRYFQQTRSVDGGGQTIRLVLTNAIESAVRVDALPVVAARNGVPVNCTTTCDPPLPVTLAATDSDHPTPGALTITVTPVTGPVDDALQIAYDVSHCQVQPNAEALLRKVLNPNVPVKASMPVTVTVPAVLFGSDPDPAKKILVITITFQNGNTIQFQAPSGPGAALVASDKPGQVNLTVFDYLLRRGQGGVAFKYKVAITYATGHTTTDAEWRSASSDNFVLDLP